MAFPLRGLEYLTPFCRQHLSRDPLEDELKPRKLQSCGLRMWPFVCELHVTDQRIIGSNSSDDDVDSAAIHTDNTKRKTF